MFSSISKTTPQSQASTSFVANRAMTIAPITPFAVTVNGQTPANASSISVQAGSTVTATITTPDDWLWHSFYHYEIDGVPQSFAVINKSSYVIKVKPADAIKRWYLYTPTEHTLTYKSTVGTDSALVLGTNYELIDETYHIVLNPLNNSVYFYGTNGIQLSKVTLPAAPIDYVKIPDKQSVVVLVTGGESYEIFLNNSVAGIAPFYARRNYSEFTDLGYVGYLPGEDLVSYLRKARSKKAIPPATCITYNGIFVIAAGNGSIWVVDPLADFLLINDFAIDEFVLNIAPLPDNTGVLLVTQSQKIYVMSMTGNLTELWQGTALWQPALFNGKVYIPESNVGYLKVYNPTTAQFEADIDLPEFSPSYTTVVGNKMYVCGHDSERVLVFDSMMSFTELYFPEKVTTVSVAGNTQIASHWLKDFTVLDQDDLRRIVKVEFKNRKGPVSHIGTNVVSIRTLGNPEVYARTPTDASLWVNGRRTYSNDTRGTLVTDGDIISLNYAAKVPGSSRTNCIIGDIAYDYDIEAVEQTYYPRNINLEIELPAEGGVHVRTITLPTAFSPSLISVEYGTLKVNEAYYYGNFLVGSSDIIKIEIDTRGNSALPVFTIGLRQFVIPVSTNPGSIAPTVFANINLNPSTTVTQEVEFAELPSLFDYIIPGYYNVIIRKNTLDITGNYYQQFGKGDKLIVEFTSSPKLYDNTDVYILGSTNYKFTAKNVLGFPIDYLDYGNISLPYTRLLDPYDLSLSSVSAGSIYNMVKEFAVPEVQYITANLTVSGMAVGANANISITGGDSYFVVNGNIESNVNITVFNGDQIGIARNVVSYHDVPVYIVQHLPTGDEDGWADVSVGQWEIVNRQVDEPTTTETRSIYDLAEQSIGTPNISHSITVIEALAELNRLPIRNLHAYKEQIQLTSLLDSGAPTIKINPNGTVRVNSARQAIELYPVLQTDSMKVDAQNTIPGIASASDVLHYVDNTTLDISAPVEKIKSSIRVINAATEELTSTMDLNVLTSTVEFAQTRMFNATAGVPLFVPGIGIASIGSKPNQLTQPSDIISQTKAARFVLNIRTVVSTYSEFVQTAPFILFDRRAGRDTGLYDSTLDGSKPAWSNMSDLVPETIIAPAFDRIAVITNATDIIPPTLLRDNKRLVPSVGEKLDKELAVVMDASYIPTQEKTFYSINDTAPPAANHAPIGLYDFIKPLSMETNVWLDKDVTWQGFIYTSTQEPMALPSYSATAEIIEKYLPATALALGAPVTDYITPLAAPEYYGNWEQLEFAGNHEGFIKSKMVLPLVAHLHVADILKMNPRGRPAINFVGVGFDFVILGVGDTIDSIEFVSGHESSTIAKTIPTALQPGQAPSVKTPIEVFRLTDPSKIKMITVPSTKGLPTLVKMIPDTSLDNLTMVTAVYESELYPILLTQLMVPYKELPINLYFDQTLPAPAEKINLTNADMLPSKAEPNILQQTAVYAKHEINLTPNTAVYARELATDGTYITANYSKDIVPSLIIGDVKYARDEPLPITKIAPIWALADYGMDPVVIYKLQHQQQNDDATTKIKMVRDTPNTYFTYITIPELNNGIVWDHDISVPYGAFATEADAIYAARNYTEFRPYLIMDTDLWSYRVLLDTGLVCGLPKGRYPIAWLIRGG